MRIFVTGATGYIGAAVSAALKKRGHDVVGLARSQEAADALLKAGVHPVRGSLRDGAVLKEMAHDADAIITLAQEYSAQSSDVDSAAIDGLLEGIDTDHEAFVYTSGCWVYGNTNGVAVAEDAKLDPTPMVAWRPGHEKRVLEHTRGGRAMVIRPGMVYGGHGGIIMQMIADAKKNNVITPIGDGKNVWPLVHVDDLAQLYVTVLERGTPGAIYNAAEAESRPVHEIADAVARKTGARVEYVALEKARTTLGPMADALVLDQRIDSSRAQRELDWKPGAHTVFTAIDA